MAYAIAEECAGRGAEVILVSGPVQIKTIHPNIKLINVISAEEMYIASVNIFHEMNIAILAAAVADFSPEITYKEKLKRGKDDFVINLKPTKDIAQSLGQMKTEKQLLIGFALETDNEVENASLKLKNKNLDMIVLNSLKDPGAGFQSDTNKVTIIDKNNIIDKFELKSKTEVAVDVVEKITGLWNGL
jgi:phosphopantothenoylcysteine decarboxylase/phosphopantothenate--cysteine ligase